MGKQYELLLFLKNDENLTQRKLSKLMNVSLGTVNNLIKNLEIESYLEVSQSKGGIKYIVTDSGEELLDNYLTNQKNVKIKNIQSSQIDTAVILAAKLPDSIDKVPLELNIDNQTTIFQRLINQLSINGIEKYIMVLNEKNKCIEEYCNRNNIDVQFIFNKNAQITGTMSSLSLIKKLIKSDFILIEGDLVFETRALTNLVTDANANAIVCTGLSGLHEEAFVDTDSKGFLENISKDIRQMKNLTIEFIGVSKITKEFFEKMLNYYNNSKNEWLNYEYLIVNVARNELVKCVVIDNLVWLDIDDEKRYDLLKNDVYPKIRIRENRENVDFVKKTIRSILNISNSIDIDVKDAGGMTNDNYKVSIKSNNYFVRIPGAGTNKIIIRKNEEFNSKLASTINVTPKVYYFDSESGIKVVEEIKGSSTLTKRTIRTNNNLVKSAKLLRKLHDTDIKFKNSFNYLEQLDNYELIMKSNHVEPYKNYFQIKNILLSIMGGFDFKNIKPCHIDLVPENFILDDKDKMFLIDWEYSGMCDYSWDLASFCNESDLSDSEILIFLEKYYEKPASQNDIKKIYCFMAFQHILWSIWALNKASVGEDFGSYGSDRFKKAEKIVENFK